MPTQTPIEREVDYRDWAGATSVELGYEGDHLRTERHRYTDEHNHQQFNITEIDARPNSVGPTVIYLASHNYRIDELLERRMSIYATHNKCRVIICEMPGITMDRDDPEHTRGAYQMPLQTLSVFGGNYEVTALAQLKAIDAVIGLDEGQEIHLLGESMSTHSVVGALQSVAHGKFEKNLQFTKIDLIESVNTSGNYPWSKLLDLRVKLLTVEALRRKIYLDENKLIHHDGVGLYEERSKFHEKIFNRLNARQRLAALATGLGVRIGIDTGLLSFMRDPTPSSRLDLRGTRITLITARESTVSSVQDSQKLVEGINELGGHAEHIVVKAGEGDVTPDGQVTPIGHAFGTSLARQASEARITYDLAA